MYQYTRYLLAFALVVISAVLANPCHAQAVDNTDAITNDTSMSLESIFESNDSSGNKSELPSDAVSQTTPQTTAVTKPNPNPRTPIYSRIFPVPSMQQ